MSQFTFILQFSYIATSASAVAITCPAPPQNLTGLDTAFSGLNIHGTDKSPSPVHGMRISEDDGVPASGSNINLQVPNSTYELSGFQHSSKLEIDDFQTYDNR